MGFGGMGFAGGMAQGNIDAVDIAAKQQQQKYQQWLVEQQRQEATKKKELNEYMGSTLGAIGTTPPPPLGSTQPMAPPPGQSSVAPQPFGPTMGMGQAPPQMRTPLLPPQQMGMVQAPPQQMGMGQLPPDVNPASPQNLATLPMAPPGGVPGMIEGSQGAPPAGSGQPLSPVIPPYQTTDGVANPPPAEDQKKTDYVNDFTPQNVMAAMKRGGVPPAAYMDVMVGLKPLFDEANQEKMRRLEFDRIKAHEAATIMKDNLAERRENRMETYQQAQTAHMTANERHALAMEGLAQQRITASADKVKNSTISGIGDESIPANVPQKALAGWSQDGYDIAVRRTILEGTSTLSRYSKDQKALIDNGIAEVAKSSNMTAQELLSQAPERKAVAMALNQTQKDVAMITPYKEMLDTNATIAAELADKVIKTDSKLANVIINDAQKYATDNEDLADFLAQIRIVQSEANRVLNNPRLVGTLSFAAKKEMNEILDGSMPLKSTKKVIARLKLDGDNRINGMKKQLMSLRSELEGNEKSTSKGKTTDPGSTSSPEGYDEWVKAGRPGS